METLHNTYDAMERLLKPKGRFFWYAYDALIHWCLRRNIPKACPYVVMRFVPSLIVAGMNHRISSRLTRIPREDYLWEFVGICVNSWQKKTPI